MINKNVAKTQNASSNEKKYSLQGNLSQTRRSTRATVKLQESPVKISIPVQSVVKKERQKNKLQLKTDEKEDVKKYSKYLSRSNKKEPLQLDNAEEGEGEQQQEEEEEKEEEEYACLSDFSASLKKIKQTRVGLQHQATIPESVAIRSSMPAPRKFKRVWSPDALETEKLSEFFNTVRLVLFSATYHEDFLIRLLTVNQMDCDKTLDIIKSNKEYFANLFKQRGSYTYVPKLLTPNEAKN